MMLLSKAGEESGRSLDTVPCQFCVRFWFSCAGVFRVSSACGSVGFSCTGVFQFQDAGALLVLTLRSHGDASPEVAGPLKEGHERRLCQQRRKDLGQAHRPITASGLTLWARPPTLARLSDLQHQAGYHGDGLEELALLRVSMEHVRQGLTELDKLPLKHTHTRIGGVCG